VAHLTHVRLYHAAPYIVDALKIAFPLALVGSIVGEFIGGKRASATSFFRVSSRLTRRWCLRRSFQITYSGDRWNRRHRPVRALVPAVAPFAASAMSNKDEAMSMSVNPVIRVMILCAMALFAGTLSPHAQKLDKLKKNHGAHELMPSSAGHARYSPGSTRDISGKRASTRSCCHHRQRFRQYRDRQQQGRLSRSRCIRPRAKHCERRKDSGIRGLSRHQCQWLASLQPIPTPESLVGRKIAAALTDSSRIVVPIVYSLKNLDASKLEWQAADPGTYFSLLLSGRVDVIAAAMDADRPALSKAGAAQNKQVNFAAFADWDMTCWDFSGDPGARVASGPMRSRCFANAVVKSVNMPPNSDEAGASWLRRIPLRPGLVNAQ